MQQYIIRFFGEPSTDSKDKSVGFDIKVFRDIEDCRAFAELRMSSFPEANGYRIANVISDADEGIFDKRAI